VLERLRRHRVGRRHERVEARREDGAGRGRARLALVLRREVLGGAGVLLDALQLLVVFGVVVLVGVVGVFVSHIFFLRWLYLVMEVVVRPTSMRSTP